jgi:LPS-assembly protein
LTFNESENSSRGYSTSNESIGLTDQRHFGPKTSTQFDANYFNTNSTFESTTSSSNTQSTERVDVHFNAQQDLNTVQAALDYQRSIPIGSTATFLGASDETPVISLTSDSQRLFGSKSPLTQSFPFKTLISWGDFEDPTGKEHISRSFFDFSFNKYDTSKNRFRVDFTGDFNQGFYSDSTAQYVLNFGTNMRYDLGGNTGVNVRYNYLKPYGYSPLSIDETGQTDYLSGDLNIRPVKPLLIGAQSGFDIQRMQEHQIGWQPIGLRTEYTPERWFMVRFLSTYQTFDKKWGTEQFDITYLPGATRVTVGSTFDGASHTWSTVNVFVDNLKWGRFRLGTALSYNGYLKMFDSEQINAVYDLHCAEAIFELLETNDGFRPGTQLSFFIRLKALPYDVPFGVGTRGQPIGFNTAGSQF